MNPKGAVKHKARNEVKGQISPYFTLSFDGPRALHAFQECVKALSPCSFKVVQIGSHTRISFDEIPAKRGNSA